MKFQSTHPSRGATTSNSGFRARSRNFNPRTPHGVRHACAQPGNNLLTDFNPRTPHGVRHNASKNITNRLKISIHAPLTGCDRARGRPGFWCSRFQSTHPSRGATFAVNKSTHTLCISIHAPLTGCDLVLATSFFCAIVISIHAPLTGCDKGYSVFRLGRLISIHAPLTGCDFAVVVIYKIAGRISIHAPLTGCDV